MLAFIFSARCWLSAKLHQLDHLILVQTTKDNKQSSTGNGSRFIVPIYFLSYLSVGLRSFIRDRSVTCIDNPREVIFSKADYCSKRYGTTHYLIIPNVEYV